MASKRRSALAWGLLLLMAGATVSCSRSPEERSAQYLTTGKKFLERKDYARAILQFKNAAKLKPKDADPYYQLALAYLAQGALREAVNSLNRTLQADPNHAAAQLKLAQLMTATARKELVEEAETRLQDLVATDPSNPDVLDALAGAQARLGKLEEAEKHLQAALKAMPAHIKSSMDLASLKLYQKDVAGAEQILKKAVQQAPQSVAAALALGNFYMLTRRPLEAETEMRRALQLDPANGPALIALGALQLTAGQKQQAEDTYRRASALPNPQYRPLLGIFLFQQGRKDEAVREFKRLAAQDPSDRAARSRLVSAYLATNQVAEAERVLATAIQRSSKDTVALLERSMLNLQAGKDVEAEKDLQQVLHYQPDSPAAHYALARVHRSRGRYLLQRGELEQALRLQPGLFAARMELASALIGGNNAKTALQVLEETPPAQKQSLPWLVTRNWVLLALGQDTNAQEGIARGLAAARTPDLLLQDAFLKVRKKDLKGALVAVDEALTQKPDELRGWRLLGDIYTAQKQFPKAVERLRQTAAQYPRSAPLQYLLGTWQANTQQRPAARTAFLAAKVADPRFYAADLAVAQLDLADNQPDAARRTLNSVISASPRNASARLLLGMIDEQAGQRDAAISHYRAVVDTDDKNVIALNNLAYLLIASSPREALKYAQQAVALNSEAAALQDTLGWAYYHNGLYGSAIKHLEEAVAKESTGRRKYHLGMAYLKRGDRELAEKTLKAALEMDPKLAASEPELRSLRK